MNTKHLCIALVFPVIGLFAACGHNHEEHHDHDGHDDHDEHVESADEHDHEHGHSDDINFPHDKAAAAGVKVSRVTSAPFAAVIPVGGKVLPASGREATVAATMSGIVHLTGTYNTGTPVSAGTTLFTISTSKLAEGDVNRRNAVALEKARTDYDRVRKLAESGLATAAELSAAKADYDNARIALEAGGAGGAKGVSSPMSGYVRELLVKEGDYVEVGTPLLSVSQTKRLQLRAEVPERDWHQLGKLSSAKFRTAYSDRVYDLRNLNGRIVSQGSMTDGNSHFVPVIFEFDNAGDIVPGAYAEVFLLAPSSQSAISVPKSAVTEEQGVYYVYIREEEDVYHKQEVTLGKTDGERYEVLRGLKDGDVVVVEGAMRVRLASAKNAIPGHTHNH